MTSGGPLRGDGLVRPGLGRRAEEDDGVPELERVAIPQASPAHDALAIDERAVAREPVVGEGPLLPHSLELGVHPGDLGIELEAHVGSLASAHAQPTSILHEPMNPLAPLGVPVDEERQASPLGLDSLLQLARGLRGHGTTCHAVRIGTDITREWSALQPAKRTTLGVDAKHLVGEARAAIRQEPRPLPTPTRPGMRPSSAASRAW